MARSTQTAHHAIPPVSCHAILKHHMTIVTVNLDMLPIHHFMICTATICSCKKKYHSDFVAM
jgi:hypothetical protein